MPAIHYKTGTIRNIFSIHTGKRSYRIVKEEWANEYGEYERMKYIVQMQKRFLWIFPWWHTINDGASELTFDSPDIAETFIKEVLATNKIRSGWNTTVIHRLNTNSSLTRVRIEELPEKYRNLALRYEPFGDDLDPGYTSQGMRLTDHLNYAFEWDKTQEGYFFWKYVNEGKYNAADNLIKSRRFGI